MAEISLIISWVSADRPGVVEQLSSLIAEHGGNWQESRLIRLGGQFAGVVRVSVEASSVDACVEALQSIADATVQVVREESEGESKPAGVYCVDIVGQDRPGIVHEVSHALASRGINLEEIHTELESAPMTGDHLFHAKAQVSLPEDLVDSLESILEGLSDDIMVTVEQLAS